MNKDLVMSRLEVVENMTSEVQSDMADNGLEPMLQLGQVRWRVEDLQTALTALRLTVQDLED
jgi:hypothetical protein